MLEDVFWQRRIFQGRLSIFREGKTKQEFCGKSAVLMIIWKEDISLNEKQNIVIKQKQLVEPNA